MPCLVRLLGVIEAEQSEGARTLRNDRLVGKVAQSRQYADVQELGRLGSGFVDELSGFFETYTV
jgi:hypothetical protein